MVPAAIIIVTPRSGASHHAGGRQMRRRVTTAAASLIVCLAAMMNCFAQANERTTHSVLAIEYVGEQDGIVNSVLMSNSRAGAEWGRRMLIGRFAAERADAHVVDMSLLNDVIARIDGFESSRQRHAESAGGTSVQISIVTPERNSSFFYESTEALSLLEDVQKACRNDESLSGDIAYFQKRVVQYRRR
ncbi:hypothetical protein [Bradyrhizobium sp. SZCCHNR1002]|uniref:hypothetical protein n=1 Tax=Bradyrhizobium sp. SZCCHNR1002 TaxID=3057334 RepID=UPI0028E889C3|nr:hypothetical protein [Bradyrhizobium sp. SZCCHNR1002]